MIARHWLREVPPVAGALVRRSEERSVAAAIIRATTMVANQTKACSRRIQVFMVVAVDASCRPGRSDGQLRATATNKIPTLSRAPSP
jgi:hypothetical protein